MRKWIWLMMMTIGMSGALSDSVQASCCYPQRQYRGKVYRFTANMYYPAVWYEDCDVLSTYKIPGAATWPGLKSTTVREYQLGPAPSTVREPVRPAVGTRIEPRTY